MKVRQYAPGLIFLLFQMASGYASAENMAGYSTILRVEFVLGCMRDHQGSRYELMNKCSCVLDQLGEEYSAEEFINVRTTAMAITIAGERGSALRDNERARALANTYRSQVSQAEVACFLRRPEGDSE